MSEGPAETSVALLPGDRTFFARPTFGLHARLGALAALFIVELIAISLWVDTSVLQGKPGLPGWIENAGKAALQAMVAFAALFLTFGYLHSKGAWKRISRELAEVPIQWRFLAGHALAMTAFAGLTSVLFSHDLTALQGNVVAGSWMLVGACGIVLGVFGAISPSASLYLFRCTGAAWAYASGGAVIVFQLVGRAIPLWQPATGITFVLVRTLLGFFVADVVADPATSMIGTREFTANIGWGCSGIEGLVLILVFTSAWLAFFRHELRFPRALLLIPAGVVILWTLNVARITALILIGSAGAPAVAVGGFHSAAGWICFNAVALGLSLAAQRMHWITAGGQSNQPEVRTLGRDVSENPTAAYLIPFLTVLAAGMLGRATSGGFEWLYPLRFLAAGIALWMFRDKYKNLNWSFGWLAPVAGVAVFGMWMALERLHGGGDSSLGANLAALPSAGRVAWIGFRVLAAVITVPIVEELAFRGFLMRRLISADFESVGLQVFRISAVLISSLAFGVLHGDRWIAGAMAGIVYAGAQLWRGRTGDAIVAHGVTNALIAAWVLYSGDWNLW
jgi:exosortase E/protease (VPEID-CTERM system)